MRALFYALLMLAGLTLAGAAIAGKPVSSKTIPVGFQGDWALDTRECAPGPSDSGNMRITARKIVNFESLGRVMRVIKLDAKTIRVESQFTQGAGRYGSADMMTLSKDRQRLTIGEHKDISVYKRCAA